MVDKKTVINFLKKNGVSGLSHTNFGLLDHLVGTEDLLRSWNAQQDVCVAGLMHSVFGTEYYKQKLIPQSMCEKVEKIIGKNATNLVYLFGVMDRNNFLS